LFHQIGGVHCHQRLTFLLLLIHINMWSMEGVKGSPRTVKTSGYLNNCMSEVSAEGMPYLSSSERWPAQSIGACPSGPCRRFMTSKMVLAGPSSGLCPSRTEKNLAALGQSALVPSGPPRYMSIAKDQRFLNPSSVFGGATWSDKWCQSIYSYCTEKCKHVLICHKEQAMTR
jgi:hypothetical protein